MTPGVPTWPVRLSAAAEADIQAILDWTLEQFGEAQTRVYAQTLSEALESLATGPKVIGVKARNDIARGLFTLHVARQSRKGRHVIMFRTGRDRSHKVIDVLRILHDAMDLPRHLP